MPDVQNISKCNDNYKYMLSGIDVLSKTDKAVTSTFQHIFTDKKYSKPQKRRLLTLRTGKIVS